MLLDVGGEEGVSKCSRHIFFSLKKIGFAPWQDIILSQDLMYYWQEMFLLTLTPDRVAMF